MIATLLVLAAQLARAVAPQDSGTRVPAIVERAPLDTAAAVNFRALVLPDTVYVGQQVTYQLGVFLDESVRDRLRRMEALAPEMRAMMAYDPPAPTSGFARRVVGEHRYEAHVYQRPIFPLSPGRFVIPPARLVYAMPLSYSFFSREESFELRSDSAVVVAVEPPLSTRPADYTGAVGSLQIDARLDTSAARVGDPLRLTIRVSGGGNVKLFPRPRIDVPWASIVPAGERVTLAPDSLDVRGVKEFDWVLTPLKAGRLALSAVRYPYFDPVARRYAVAYTRPETLNIAPGALAALDSSGARRPRWAVRTEYRGAIAAPVYRGRPFWVVMLLAPLPAMAVLARRRPRRRRRARSWARSLRALARDGARGDDARAVRRAFVAAVGERLRHPPASLAEPTELAHALRRAGTSAPTASECAELLAQLNDAAFGGTSATLTGVAKRAYTLFRAVDIEARAYRAPTRLALAVLAVAAAATVRAAMPDTAATQFARGVESYNRGHYALAARDFAAVAALVPRAPDAWANYGTAAFAAGDSAHAALGWQRALRLEPLAFDVRERLDLLAPASGFGVGAVPPIPPLPLALLAASLWIAGWVMLAWPRRRRGWAGSRTAALTAAVAALVLGEGAAFLDERLAARDLVVVAHDTPLRLLPALGADRGAVVRVGEAARVLEREGPWAHVVADGERDGWIEAAAVLPIPHD